MEINLGATVRIPSPNLYDDDAAHADGSVIGIDADDQTAFVEYRGRIETWPISTLAFDPALGLWRAAGRGEIVSTT